MATDIEVSPAKEDAGHDVAKITIGRNTPIGMEKTTSDASAASEVGVDVVRASVKTMSENYQDQSSGKRIRWKTLRHRYDDSIDAGEWASFEDPPGVYHETPFIVEEMHNLVTMTVTAFLWAFMYFLYFAVPGSTWVETNTFGRFIHLALTSFGCGGPHQALFCMGFDVQTWWKEKKFMVYWSLKYTSSVVVISFLMMEATGAKKQLHFIYILAMLVVVVTLFPLYESVRFLAGDKNYMNPFHKPSFAILEGLFYHVLAVCSAMTPQLYFMLDNCYLSSGNMPWDDNLKSQFIVFARPFFWMCVKRFTVTVCIYYVNQMRLPYGLLYGHLIAYTGLAFVTGTGAASCSSWYFCCQFIFCDWVTFGSRIWCFSGMGQNTRLGPSVRQFLLWGKSVPLHGMKRKQLRALDIISEDNANTTGFLAIIMLYGFCSIDIQGMDTLKIFVFPHGVESLQYVLMMFLSELIQDLGGRVYIGRVLRSMSQPCSYSKIWGKCWSPNVLRTQFTLISVSAFNVTIMAWVIPFFKSNEVGAFAP